MLALRFLGSSPHLCTLLDLVRVLLSFQCSSLSPDFSTIEGELKDHITGPMLQRGSGRRGAFPRQTGHMWDAGNQLSEIWRWAAVGDSELPSSATGHGRIPRIGNQDLRPPQRKPGSRAMWCLRGEILSEHRGNWNMSAFCEEWRARVSQVAAHRHGSARVSLEDIRDRLVQVNSKRKQERFENWRYWSAEALDGNMTPAFRSRKRPQQSRSWHHWTTTDARPTEGGQRSLEFSGHLFGKRNRWIC